MSREPMEGRPYKNVDKSKVPPRYSMCWKCGKIVPDSQTVLYKGEPDKIYDGCWVIADFLCIECNEKEYSKKVKKRFFGLIR